MATPQSPNAAAELINRVAGQAMGGAPADPAAAAATAAPQKPVTDTSGKAPETTVGNAEAAGAPNTEAQRMAQDAIMYEIPTADGKTRQMTPQQINSAMDRYSALNYQHSQLKPVIDVVNAYIRQNPNTNPQEIAGKLLDLVRANQPNAQFGNQAEQQQQRQAQFAPADREALAKWAEDNAVALPPGYEGMMTGMAQQQQAMSQMMRMMQQVLGQSQGMTQAAAIANRGVQSDRSQMIQRQIGQNLDQVQQHLQLPADAANDFMMFAGERGFTLEDFVDPQLTLKVMTDFKNTLAGPEMERIRQIAQRRQAFTGNSLGATPSAGPATAAAPAETPFDRLTQVALEKKMGT